MLSLEKSFFNLLVFSVTIIDNKFYAKTKIGNCLAQRFTKRSDGPRLQIQTFFRYVKLNVGGALFHTTIDTLSKHDSMLRAMFSGRVPVSTLIYLNSLFILHTLVGP